MAIEHGGRNALPPGELAKWLDHLAGLAPFGCPA